MHQQAQLRLKKDDVGKLGAEVYVVLAMDLHRTRAFKEQNLLLSKGDGKFSKEKSLVYATALSDPAGYASALYGVARKGLRWGAWVENQPHWFVIDRTGTLTFKLEPKFDTPTSYEKDVDLVLEALKKAAAQGGPESDRPGGIRATQEDEATIRVIVPEQFETTFTKQKGFGGVWFDLKHDPQKKRDLAPVLDENGFLWVKASAPGTDGSWYANPPREVTLLESGPARVRVRLSGPHRRYGQSKPDAEWKGFGFEQTFTVYPSGKIYVDYVLIAEQPTPLHHFLVILKPNGAWGKNGKGEGAGEAHCEGEFGPDKPYDGTASSFALEWTNGPTWFQDILMVMHRGKYNGSYWNEGYEDKDLRAGLDLLGRWPDRIVPKGRDHIHLMMVFRHDIDGHAAAQRFASDYRSPGRLTVSKGKLDTTDDGDADADGFNESEGCYVLKSSSDGISLTIDGKAAPRMFPAFKIKSWPESVPESLTLEGEQLKPGLDFSVAARDGVLLLHVLRVIKDRAMIVIPGP
jgi:hypothetical protein